MTTDWPSWVQPIDSRFELAFSVRINGKPRGKGSVRVVEWNGRKHGMQAPLSREYENLIAMLSRHQPAKNGHELPLGGPLVARIWALGPRPAKMSGRLIVPFDQNEPDGRLLCPEKPDWDNISKSVCDGLKKGGVIRDDALIWDGRAITLWGRPGETSHIEACVFALARNSLDTRGVVR